MKVENPRTDILSRKRFSREDLVRFVVFGGVLTKDDDHKLPGRGVYLKKGSGSLALERQCFLKILHRPLTLNEEEEIRKV